MEEKGEYSSKEGRGLGTFHAHTNNRRRIRKVKEYVLGFKKEHACDISMNVNLKKELRNDKGNIKQQKCQMPKVGIFILLHLQDVGYCRYCCCKSSTILSFFLVIWECFNTLILA